MLPCNVRSQTGLRGPRLRGACAALGLTLLLAGCGDVVGPPASLTGHWTSAATGGSTVTSGSVQLELVQQGDELTGTGTFGLNGGSTELSVSGFVQGTVVMLSLEGGADAPFTTPLQYSAVLLDSRRQMEGTLTHQNLSESRTFVR